MKYIWTLFVAFLMTSAALAQEATKPQGPTVTARDDATVAASEEDEGEGRFYVEGAVGGQMMHHSISPRHGSNLRSVEPYLILRLGYDFADSPWSLEGFGMFGRYNTYTGKAKNGLYGFGIDALYHFNRYAAFDPFLSVGAGAYGGTHETPWVRGEDIEAMVQVGVGAFWHLNENLSLRGDLRYHLAIDNDYKAFTSADIGLVYAFGACDESSEETLAPVGTLEPGAQAYDDASAHTAILKDVTPVGTEDKMMLELHVQYAKDTAIIEPSNYPALDELTRMIRAAIAANPEVYVTIDGHADRQHGSDHTYNLRLSEARAKSVLTYISENGVPAAKMKAAGHSFDQPKDPVNLDEGTPTNRRTEVVIHGVDEATRAKIRAGK